MAFILSSAKTDVHSKIEGMDCRDEVDIEKPYSIQYHEACMRNLIELRGLWRQKF